MQKLIRLQHEHDGLFECARKRELALQIASIHDQMAPKLGVYRNGVEIGYLIEDDDVWYLQFKNGKREEVGFNKQDSKTWLNTNGYFVKARDHV